MSFKSALSHKGWKSGISGSLGDDDVLSVVVWRRHGMKMEDDACTSSCDCPPSRHRLVTVATATRRRSTRPGARTIGSLYCQWSDAGNTSRQFYAASGTSTSHRQDRSRCQISSLQTLVSSMQTYMQRPRIGQAIRKSQFNTML